MDSISCNYEIFTKRENSCFKNDLRVTTYILFICKYRVSCPPKDKMMQPNGFASHEELIGIYDSRTAIDPSDWQDDQDDWEDNDV